MLKLEKRHPGAPEWERPGWLSPIMHELLTARGITSEKAAEEFLHPDVSQLHNPFLMSDMSDAVDTIRDAVSRGEGICVYGDYDVDGVCASSIVMLYLKKLGYSNCMEYLPSRHEEGYGLNEAAIDKISQKYSLMVSVDCGITAHDLVEHAKLRGMRVVITDHHRPDDNLPECSAVVNPLLNNYPFGYLCGAGVAFKLVHALAAKEAANGGVVTPRALEEGLRAALEYIDLAALATIADIVKLTDENRVIAYLGLKRINESMRPGIKALLEASSLGSRGISAGNVAFQLSPRLNASGRMGDAGRAFKLLTSTDTNVCRLLAEELNSENERRKSEEKLVMEAADARLKDYDFITNRAIIIEGNGWNKGVIGLAASKITEKFGYPAVVLTDDGDSYIGSCRSLESIDIQEALTHVADLLERFGGHKMAAGLKLPARNLAEFKRRLNEYLSETYPSDAWMPVFRYDADIEADELKEELVEELKLLEPTGCENPAAVLCMTSDIVTQTAVGQDKNHLKLCFRGENGKPIDGIWFRNGDKAGRLPARARVLFAPKLNEWMNKISVQADVCRVIAADAGALLSAAKEREKELFARFILAARPDTNAEPAEGTESGFARQKFKNSIQGSVIIVPDTATAQRFSDIGADINTGVYSDDERLFNQLVLCPEGENPLRYENVYLAGIPACLVPGGTVLNDIEVSKFFDRLPDTDELRRLFTACRDWKKQNKTAKSVFELVQAAAGGDICAAALGIKVLEHAHLVEFTETPRGVSMDVWSKSRPLSPDTVTNPTDDSLYKALSHSKKEV